MREDELGEETVPTGESDHMGPLNLVKAFGSNSKVWETGGGRGKGKAHIGGDIKDPVCVRDTLLSLKADALAA